MRDRKKRKRRDLTALVVLCTAVILLLIAIALLFMMRHRDLFTDGTSVETELETKKAGKKKKKTETESETGSEAETERELFVPQPEISEQILTVNEWSRPGTKIKSLDYIVIHYLGNPNTTAKENRDYFESLKNLQDISMSANYVVGLEGEIIHCVPDDEVAYASNSANEYSISIENCHPDTSGKFTDETYDSLVKLVAYLSEKYNLGKDQIIRHYDVTGKYCPKYFVYHPRRWKQFLNDVMDYRAKCRDDVLAEREGEKKRIEESEAEKLKKQQALAEKKAAESEIQPSEEEEKE